MIDKTNDTNTTADDEQSFANVIKLAGPQAEIPIGIESRVHHRVQDEWRASTAQLNGDKAYDAVHKNWKQGTWRSSILRWMIPIGVAASSVVAVLVVSQPPPAPIAVAATVSRVIGSGAANEQYPLGTKVHAGDTISTGPAEGVSLLLARSESLRIDANSRIRVEAKDHFTLLSGRIYTDSGQFVYRSGGLRIDTDYGSVTDVGTQFSVTANVQGLDVAVREGRVDINSQFDTYVAMVGERITLVQGRVASVVEIESYDDYWRWAADLAPTYDTKNKSQLDLLNWAARETGWKLHFDDHELRMSAMAADVSGPVADLTPSQALESVLKAGSFSYRFEEDKLVIEH